MGTLTACLPDSYFWKARGGPCPNGLGTGGPTGVGERGTDGEGRPGTWERSSSPSAAFFPRAAPSHDRGGGPSRAAVVE
jgi:hypothetical protein